MKTPKTTKLIIAAIFFSVVGLTSLNTSATHAIDVNDICGQSGISQEVKNANGCGSGDASNDLSNAIVAAINGVIGILGVVAAIFIIVGAINYMTSSGDSGKVEKAKKTILYAAIGLVIAALTLAIVNFVIANILKQ